MTGNSQNDEGTPVFHPVHQRRPDAWFPGDESASLLIAIEHTWEDIKRLADLRKAAEDAYDRRLLFKYVIIEVRSLTQMMDRLRTKVMTAQVYVASEQPPYRGISDQEAAAAREYWKKYSEAQKETERDLIAVRNKLAAHRDVSDWQVVMALWDKLDSTLIVRLLEAIPPAFNHAKELNIFEWNRQPEPGVIEILGGPVGPWLFEEPPW